MGFGSVAESKAAAQHEFKLEVIVISACDLHDTQLIGKQDPQVEVSVKKQTFLTSTFEDGQDTAEWNETFYFNNLSAEVCVDSVSPLRSLNFCLICNASIIVRILTPKDFELGC